MEKKVKIDGMKCNGCANRVKNALELNKLIKNVEVNLEEKIATITMKKEVEDQVITDVIEKLGFKVVEIIK